MFTGHVRWKAPKPHTSLTTLVAVMTMGLALATGCGGGSSTSSGSSLTPDQQVAATNSVTAMNDSSSCGSSLDVLTNAQVLQAILAGATPSTTTVNIQNGPVVTVTKATSSLTVSVNYGAGVTGANGNVTAGIVAITIDPANNSGSLAFNNFTVNGQTITGTVTLSAVSYNANGASADLSENLTISTFGTVVGTADISYKSLSQTLTISTGNFTVTPLSGGTYAVALSNIVIPPSVNGSTLPSAGTMTITYTPSGSSTPTTLQITFSSQTPIDRIVKMSVDGSPSFYTTLPT
jgi:hypothetical protein